MNRWDDLLTILRDLGSEFGFHEVTLDLTGRKLPRGIESPITMSCTEERAARSRYWRVEIPIGSGASDEARIVFSRPVAEDSTNYMVSVLVESVSSALPRGARPSARRSRCRSRILST